MAGSDVARQQGNRGTGGSVPFQRVLDIVSKSIILYTSWITHSRMAKYGPRSRPRLDADPYNYGLSKDNDNGADDDENAYNDADGVDDDDDGGGGKDKSDDGEGDDDVVLEMF
ncbi:hypothetical protein PoB_001889600 [Plakobranchus ocellatus]|uniref:Uncharacterized protein n=1 Tax=Plakobranchus ocellatus TaxID=259542 RepID=A0AAV3YZB1_9GAST|nr:hypothetical protein PoB_001889600 [Plakobranchus ocellatus]